MPPTTTNKNKEAAALGSDQQETKQPQQQLLTSQLEFHGAAASSSPHSLVYLPSSNTVVYASNCIVNLARRIPLVTPNNTNNTNTINNDDDNDDEDSNGGGEGCDIPIEEEEDTDDSDEEEEEEENEGIGDTINSKQLETTDGGNSTFLHHVDETLRTSTISRTTGDDNRCITAMALLQSLHLSSSSSEPTAAADDLNLNNRTMFVCAFSDGTLTLWSSTPTISTTTTTTSREDGCNESSEHEWTEEILYGKTASTPPSTSTSSSKRRTTNGNKDNNNEDEEEEEGASSITDVDGVYRIGRDGTIHVQVIAASSYGVDSYYHTIHPSSSSVDGNGASGHSTSSTERRRIGSYPGCSVRLHPVSIDDTTIHNTHTNTNTTTTKSTTTHTQIILACGTASPRSNRIHLYTNHNHNHNHHQNTSSTESTTPTTTPPEWRYHGSVLGHLDWVTCLSWFNCHSNNNEGGGWMLASGSQDARIRLWRIHPPTLMANDDEEEEEDGGGGGEGVVDDDSEEEDDDDDDDGDAARMHIRFSIENNNKNGGKYRLLESAVTLEALLIGHEEMITAVNWRPQQKNTNNGDNQGSSPPCLISSSMDRSILIWTEEVAVLPPTTSNDDDDDADGMMTPTTTTTTNQGLGNVWVPITRVGTAGGILGGSIGSSLLGFVNVMWNAEGTSIVGHGYGGSIHFWTSSASNSNSNSTNTSEEQPGGLGGGEVERWRANPCLTGHFQGVSDIDWEATGGRYLLSVGLDQTCRLWSLLPPLPTAITYPPSPTTTMTNNNTAKQGVVSRIWREVGRPQVHGYDLTSITCIDTHSRMCRFVSGADEKEGRVFEAPLSTIRLLDTLYFPHGADGDDDYNVEEDSSMMMRMMTLEDNGTSGNTSTRVERAYIPSLGLSQRASAADAMEEGDGDTVRSSALAVGTTAHDASATSMTTSTTGATARLSAEKLIETLPHERDLGVTSLWPEVRKLFGHHTELVCLTSITTRSSIGAMDGGDGVELEEEELVLVASSCKARDMEHASIRVWDVHRGMCVDVLKEGHKSTVVALSFSQNGTYLASSGKDRRLCIWRRRRQQQQHQHQQQRRKASSSNGFALVAIVESAHKRIVWSVDFYRGGGGSRCSGGSSSLLITGSRDGFVKLWRVTGSSNASEDNDDDVEVKELCRWYPACKVGKKVEPVTAVAFAPKAFVFQREGEDTKERDGDWKRKAVLAIGMENGLIELWGVPLLDDDDVDVVPKLLHSVPAADCHIGAIQKLAWKPVWKKGNESEMDVNTEDNGASEKGGFDMTLASCSLDHGVRILRVVGPN